MEYHTVFLCKCKYFYQQFFATITLMGKLAPGPDYKLYLSPKFVETEAAFNQEKTNMVLVSDVKTWE